MKILIIEDEKELAEGIKGILSKSGYESDAVYYGCRKALHPRCLQDLKPVHSREHKIQQDKIVPSVKHVLQPCIPVINRIRFIS